MSMKPLMTTIMKISGAIAGSFVFRVIIYTSIIAGLFLIYLTHVEGHITFIYNQF